MDVTQSHHSPLSSLGFSGGHAPRCINHNFQNNRKSGDQWAFRYPTGIMATHGRHGISLNHDAYPRLRSMLAARSNSLAVGSAKPSASAYRVTTLNSAPTATASLRASALTPALSTAFAFS